MSWNSRLGLVWFLAIMYPKLKDKKEIKTTQKNIVISD
jgi:hypothetical protein